MTCQSLTTHNIPNDVILELSRVSNDTFCMVHRLELEQLILWTKSINAQLLTGSGYIRIIFNNLLNDVNNIIIKLDLGYNVAFMNNNMQHQDYNILYFNTTEKLINYLIKLIK